MGDVKIEFHIMYVYVSKPLSKLPVHVVDI